MRFRQGSVFWRFGIHEDDLASSARDPQAVCIEVKGHGGGLDKDRASGHQESLELEPTPVNLHHVDGIVDLVSN